MIQLKVKRSKYGVRQDAAGKAARTIDGTLFASLKEAKRYVLLRQLQRQGDISHLELQPKFPLFVISNDGNMTVTRLGEYRADFRYVRDGKTVIEDCKGVQTELFIWKKKHVEAEYGIKVELV